MPVTVDDFADKYGNLQSARNAVISNININDILFIIYPTQNSCRFIQVKTCNIKYENYNYLSGGYSTPIPYDIDITGPSYYLKTRTPISGTQTVLDIFLQYGAYSSAIDCVYLKFEPSVTITNLFQSNTVNHVDDVVWVYRLDASPGSGGTYPETYKLINIINNDWTDYTYRTYSNMF